MATQSFVLGVPDFHFSGQIRFGTQPNSGIMGAEVDAALLEGGGPAFLKFIRFYTLALFASFQTASTDTQTIGSLPGPDLSSEWENFASAITLRAANGDIVIPGPGSWGGGDESEPYSQTPPAAARTALATWLAAYGGDSVTLILDDGVLPDLMPTLPAVADQVGVVGTAIDIQLPVASGGDPPLVYTLTGLASPLAFSASTRRITGTPSTAETLALTYTVTDTDGDTDSGTFDLVISPQPLLIPSVADQAGQVGVVYGFTLPEATGGTDPLVYSTADRPAGIAFNAGTRRLSGTPTTAGTYTVTYAVSGDGGQSDDLQFDFVVSPATPPPTALALSDFDSTGLEVETLALILSGPPENVFGRAPRTAYGTLQDGDILIGADDTPISWIRFFADRLTLNDNEALSLQDYFGAGGAGNDLTLWVQTEGGVTSFPLNDPNANLGGGFATFDIPASSQALIGSVAENTQFIFALTRSGDLMPTLPAVADQVGVVGTAIDIQLPEATGGDLPLAYTLAGLPVALAFDDTLTERRITGTPTTAETLTLTYTVEDDNGDTASQTFDLVISAAGVTTVTADAGANRTVASEGSVQLLGSASVVNGVGATVYSWARVSGLTGGALDDDSIAQPTYTAPAITVDDSVIYRLTVTNNGVSDTDDVTIAVTAPAIPNVAPTVSIQTTPQTVDGGGAVQLASTSADADGNIVDQEWTETGGAFNNDGIANPIWTAPAALAVDVAYTLRLTATDDDGATAFAEVIFTVRAIAAPTPPALASVGLSPAIGGGAVWAVVSDDSGHVVGEVRAIIRADFGLALNRIGRFELTLPWTADGIDYLRIGYDVDIYFAGASVNPRFRGRITAKGERVTDNGDLLLVVSGSSILIELGHYRQPDPVDVDGEGIQAAADALLAGVDWSADLSGPSFLASLSNVFQENESAWAHLLLLSRLTGAYLREQRIYPADRAAARTVEMRIGHTASGIILRNAQGSIDPGARVGLIRSISRRRTDGTGIVNQVFPRAIRSSGEPPFTLAGFPSPTLALRATAIADDDSTSGLLARAELDGPEHFSLWFAAQNWQRDVIVDLDPNPGPDLDSQDTNPQPSGAITATIGGNALSSRVDTSGQNVRTFSIDIPPPNPEREEYYGPILRLATFSPQAVFGEGEPRSFETSVQNGTYNGATWQTHLAYSFDGIDAADPIVRIQSGQGVGANRSVTAEASFPAAATGDVLLMVLAIGNAGLGNSNQDPVIADAYEIATLDQKAVSATVVGIQAAGFGGQNINAWSYQWIAFHLRGALAATPDQTVENAVSVRRYGGPLNIPRLEVVDVPLTSATAPEDELIALLRRYANEYLLRRVDPIVYTEGVRVSYLPDDGWNVGDSVRIRYKSPVFDIDEDSIVMDFREIVDSDGAREWELTLASVAEWNRDMSEILATERGLAAATRNAVIKAI